MKLLCSYFITGCLIVSGMLLGGCSDDNDVIEPLAPLLARYVLSSPDSVPEGIAFDPVDRAFYATSLQGGSITRIDADGTETIFQSADNRARLVGAKVDAESRRLWVCAQQVDGLDNRVWVFDLNSGAQVMEFLLGALSANGDCNDLVLDDSGTAYVTDPANPNIYRLDPATQQGEVFVSDPLFTDVTGAGLGLNGITLAQDGSALIVGKFIPASLLRVALPGGAITPISLSGDTLPSPDGLVTLNGDVYSVSDSSVSRTRLTANGTAGSVVVAPQISGLSTATIADGNVYAIKSEVFNFVLELPLQTPFEIFSVDLSAFEQ